MPKKKQKDEEKEKEKIETQVKDELKINSIPNQEISKEESKHIELATEQKKKQEESSTTELLNEKTEVIKESEDLETSEDLTVETESEDTSKESVRKRYKTEIKLFNKWSFYNVQVNDLSLVNYINLRPIIVPHSGGKHAHKKFWKTERVNIVERFINKMLSPGLVRRRIRGKGSSHYMGKKQKAIKIIERAFSIIEQKSNQNPIQVLVDAICKASPREETTKISLGGISYQVAVDVAPQRRVDLGIRHIIQAAIGSTYNSPKTIEEHFADEILAAAREDQNSKAIRRRDEIERVALSAR